MAVMRGTSFTDLPVDFRRPGTTPSRAFDQLPVSAEQPEQLAMKVEGCRSPLQRKVTGAIRWHYRPDAQRLGAPWRTAATRHQQHRQIVSAAKVAG